MDIWRDLVRFVWIWQQGMGGTVLTSTLYPGHTSSSHLIRMTLFIHSQPGGEGKWEKGDVILREADRETRHHGKSYRLIDLSDFLASSCSIDCTFDIELAEAWRREGEVCGVTPSFKHSSHRLCPVPSFRHLVTGCPEGWSETLSFRHNNISIPSQLLLLLPITPPGGHLRGCCFVLCPVGVNTDACLG